MTPLEEKYIKQAKKIIGKWGYEEEYWWKPIAEALQLVVEEERKRILDELPKEKQPDMDGYVPRFRDGVDMWGEQYAEKVNMAHHSFNDCLTKVRNIISKPNI